MKATYLLAFLTLSFIAVPLQGQNRLERPLQVQVNISGGFLDIAGNALTDPTVDELKVNKWKIGFSVGYHLNRQFFVGYSLYPSLDMTLTEAWGFTSHGKDGNITVDHTTGPIHSLEGRLSPFKFGLYFSGSILNIGEVDYEMDFRRMNSGVMLGDNSYDSDLLVHWNSKQVTRIGLGLGYTHVLKSGVSFNIGINVPIGFPGQENIRISLIDTKAGSIDAMDLAQAELQLKDETFYGPVVMMLNVGYNFSFRR